MSLIATTETRTGRVCTRRISRSFRAQDFALCRGILAEALHFQSTIEEGSLMGATKIILSDEVSLIVSSDLKKLQQDMYDAMGNGGWLVIQPEEGPRVSVNPRQVLYMVEVTEAEAGTNGDAPKVRARRQRQPA